MQSTFFPLVEDGNQARAVMTLQIRNFLNTTKSDMLGHCIVCYVLRLFLIFKKNFGCKYIFNLENERKSTF